jgi:DNA polymerase sigma
LDKKNETSYYEIKQKNKKSVPLLHRNMSHNIARLCQAFLHVFAMVSQSTKIFNQRYASIEKYERGPKKNLIKAGLILISLAVTGIVMG